MSRIMMIATCAMSILTTACNTTTLADNTKPIPTIQQFQASQAAKFAEVIERYKQQSSACHDRIREPSSGNWNHMDIRLPTDTCPNEHWLKLLVIDPKDPDVVYAAGQLVFKSTDAGESWTPINQMGTFLNKAINVNDFQDVSALAINPHVPSEIYMARVDHFFKSTNGGNMWVEQNDPGQVKVLIFDSEDSSTIYGGGRSGIFKSMDGGKKWMELMGDWRITTMVVDPQDSNVMYAGSEQGALFKTMNRGKNWIKVQTGLLELHITALAIDSRNHNTVYLANLAGEVYKTTNGGAQWSSTGYPKHTLIHTLVTDPLNSNTVYAGTVNGVFKTEDGGASWRADNTGLATALHDHSQVFSLAIDPRPTKPMYAVTGIGAFKRTHGGK